MYLRWLQRKQSLLPRTKVHFNHVVILFSWSFQVHSMKGRSFSEGPNLSFWCCVWEQFQPSCERLACLMRPQLRTLPRNPPCTTWYRRGLKVHNDHCNMVPEGFKDAWRRDSKPRHVRAAQRKLHLHFLSNWMVYDRGDSFPFDYEHNEILFGSYSLWSFSFQIE